MGVRKDLADKLPLANRFGQTISPREQWLQGFYCDALRAVIRKDPEVASFDFRRWANACAPASGGKPSITTLGSTLSSMNALLRRDGAFDVGMAGHIFIETPPGRFPYSL